MSDANAPSPRSDTPGVWTGSEFLIWGGSGLPPDGARYDPTTDTWTTMSTVGAPFERGDHVGVWNGASMIVWSGSDVGGSGSTNTGGLYDPITDSWTSLPT